MRLLRNFLSSIAKRRYAQVHDVKISYVQEPGRSEAADEAKTMGEKNVFSQPLTFHSARPLTGFLRTGYCEVPASDTGNHSVAGIVTSEFLDFSAARGNDLRTVGLSDGCKWCLCVARWKEAFDARSGDDDRVVPRVVLSATNIRALEGATIEELKKFAVDEGQKYRNRE